jgi:molecular chaperone DnaK
VQGEHRRADRNNEVGALQIRSRDLRVDLPKGSKVDITFTVTKSNVLKVFADVPLADIQLEAEFDFSQLRAQAPEVLEVLLVEAQQRLDRLRAKVARENAIGIAREQVLAAKVDLGAAKYAEERLRDIQAQLDDVEDAIGLSGQAQELQDLLNEAGRLVDSYGSPSDRRELEALTVRAEDAIRDQDAAAVRVQTDRVFALLVELERRSPDWPVKLFYAVQTRVPPSGEVDRLVRDGHRAVRAGDMRALEDVNQQLMRMVPPEKQAEVTGNIGVVRTR